MMAALLTTLAVALEALTNRWRGWGGTFLGIKTRVVKRASCQIVPVACLLFSGAEYWFVAPAAVVATLGIGVGHGKFFTLGRGPYPLRSDNWPAFLPRLLKLKEHSWLYDASALALTGLCFMLPYAVVAAQTSVVSCIAIIAAGILKVLAYQIGLWIVKGGDHIRISELIAGAIFGLSFSTLLWGLP